MVAPVGWRLRRLQYLAQRVAGSLAQRGWRGTLARIRSEFRHVPAGPDATLAFEPVGSLLPPEALPCADVPEVTIVVPVHGQLAWTLACLRSIARHGVEVPFEVVVVDDASPDDSAARLAGIAGLRLLRNPRNLGFVGSCNAGAAAARGKLLYFLNNDTQVTPGWLDRLCEAFREVPGCGIVGSRLVYPDGRLQEAGGLVYADAQAWNVGRFEQRNDPRYLYRREVDYVSGASLLVDAVLFRDIGGFDPRYAPAYCEDMDLAFAVRARGRKVVYEPASVVIHDEGTSSGTDPFAGVKRHQETNRVKFAAKWADALRAQPAPRTPVAQAIHRGQPHVLVMDALMPDPTRDAGSMQTIGLLRRLRELGWRVSFMADNRRATPDDILRLGRLGVETLCMPWSPDLPTWLRREGKGLGAILVSRYYVAAPHLPLFRRHAPQARVLLELADVHFLREQRAAELTGDAALARQAKETRRRELGAVAASDVTLVVSTAEQQLLARELPQARVVLVPNMHEVHGRQTPFGRRDGLLFVGGFGHPPNADAARWLATEIHPRIRARRPDITLHLVGDIPDDARRELAGAGIVLHGRVPDLLPMLEARRIALAPLRYGAGVKGKVNVAMSHGLPVVATSLAAEGMWLRDGDNALLADDADAFADAVLRLYDDEVLWTHLSDAGLENVRQHFSIDAARTALAAALG